MARIRSIKPDFFRHRRLYLAERESGLPLRVAFAGLWCAADREGRFRWEPEELKLDCLPFDELDFSRVLDALSTRGFIVQYASEGESYPQEGRSYGWIPGFKAHQFVNHRESASVLPEPPKNIIDLQTRGERVNDASGTQHDLARVEGEGKGREGKGNGEDAPAAPPTKPAEQRSTHRGTRFKPEPACPDAWRAVCMAMRTDLDADAVYGAFSDYWISKPGQYGLKLDWMATWRNWLRKEKPGTSAAGPAWWATSDAIMAKAKELGIATRGESAEALKAQIRERLGASL